MKKALAMMMGVLMMFGMTACGGTTNDEDTNKPVESEGVVSPESSEAPVEDIDVSDIKEEVTQTANLLQVTAGEGETQKSPFVKQGKGADGTACLFIHLEGEDADMEIPMDNTVTYTMEEPEEGEEPKDSYMEKVTLTMTVNGESVSSEQYRLYLNPAQD